ncbi:MAG: YraN family protein [Candidatus Omnitrophica bacterium]|nr:YraN family protein [Candidatus Omnitrophota bacterium]
MTDRQFANRLSLGKISEGIAVRYLRRKRFKIIGRNYYCRAGELDIIAKRGPIFIFVEVRSIREGFFEDPLDSITPLKIERIKTLAQIWLMNNRIDNVPVRFDAIGIIHNKRFFGKRYTITHIQDAF